jgi:RNA polymerase sigma-70 factor (ECF subfamily)
VNRPAEDVAARLSAARGGSSEALGQVLEACRGYLLLIANRELDAALQPKGGPSDLVQETFLEAQRDFARFHGTTTDELKAWLRQMLLNNLANFARRYRETAKRDLDREVGLPAGQDSGAQEIRLIAEALSPSGEAMANEQVEALGRALGRLAPDYRQVLLLRFQEQQTFEEIGKAMQRTPNAARMLWLRAVERLQHELEGEG